MVGFLAVIFAVASTPGQLYALPFVASALILGGLARLELSAMRILAAGALGLTVLLTVLFYGYNLYASSSDRLPTTAVVIDGIYDPNRMLDSLVRNSETPVARGLDQIFLKLTGETLSVAAARAQTTQDYTDFLKRNEESRQLLQRVNRFPIGLFFVAAFVYFALFYFTARWTLAKIGIRLPALDNFRTWKVPWFLSWGPITFFSLRALSTLMGNPMGEFVGESLLLASLLPYMVLACAIAAYWIERLRLDPLLTAIAYTFLIVYLRELAIVAIFDSWMDFRRLERPQEPPTPSQHDDWDDDIDF
ncbi:MAG: DUF2232 domain-containing protein [Candidatus Wallbacteria bacterium]|nr:DUF2232 domain-containing protein [Candidatus Wallbacteria bacterium]